MEGEGKKNGSEKYINVKVFTAVAYRIKHIVR
jgi:hypothetical protein